MHEVARQARPDAHIIYVDNNPVVITHAKALLAIDDSTTAVVQGDIRDAGKVFADPDVGRLIDFSRPVATLFVSVLHGIPDNDDPWGIVRAFASRMAPGSYLILSHLTRDGHPADLIRQKEEVFAKSSTPFSYRSRADILRFFDGFELVDPGLVYLTQWRPDDPAEEATDASRYWLLAGVGRRSDPPG